MQKEVSRLLRSTDDHGILSCHFHLYDFPVLEKNVFAENDNIEGKGQKERDGHGSHSAPSCQSLLANQ